jgi:hypothetical protein
MSLAPVRGVSVTGVAFLNRYRYDFDLKTGESMTGMRACTFTVETRMDSEGQETVWLETPEQDSGWRLVEMRPVSEGASQPIGRSAPEP